MITLTSLSKIYRTNEIETVALENVNLTVARGEFLSIMGPSGCGKSTLLNIMGLLDTPSTGTIEINGTHTEGMKDKELAAFRNKTLGFVFQSFHLINSLNVLDNVELPLLYRRVNSSERKRLAKEVLEKVGLSHRMNHFPTQLSGGQCQRVAVARAIIGNPEIILADEPTGNIDPEMSYEIVDLLNHINANGTTVVMVTHEHNLVRHFHHRVITIEQGAVVSDSEDTEALPDDYATIERDYASDASNAERAAAAAAAVQNIASSETVEDRVAKQKEDSISPFYVQPNSDADLEKFMATYGVDSDSSDDDVDYSKYLDAIEKKTGGDNK